MGVGHSDRRLDRMAQNAIDDMNRPGPYSSYSKPRKKKKKRLTLYMLAIIFFFLSLFLVNIVAPVAGEKFGTIGALCIMVSALTFGWGVVYKEQGTYNEKGFSDIFKDSRHK